MKIILAMNVGKNIVFLKKEMIKIELWNEIQEKQKMLDKAINELAQNGYKLAECERYYKIAVNKKALELRSQDVPVTLINQVIYGYEDIAKLRFERDTAQVKYNANLEYIQTIKLMIRILENQLSREYGNTK
jgi:hypothetical protein